MRRVGGLWPGLISWRNLYGAASAAARGKRSRPDVAAFLMNLEVEIPRLRRELSSGEYRPGPYRTFTIEEPKRRMISAAPFRDRVVHHALVRVLEPVFERRFTRDSYACRKGLHLVPVNSSRNLKATCPRPAWAGVAEGVGFEPTEAFASAVFKTAAFDRSAIPPLGDTLQWGRGPVQYGARTERCWSGRSGLPAKQLSGVTWTAGSNPALSAITGSHRRKAVFLKETQ